MTNKHKTTIYSQNKVLSPRFGMEYTIFNSKIEVWGNLPEPVKGLNSFPALTFNIFHFNRKRKQWEPKPFSD